ncbi:MAG: NfeD family protein [Oscillospiraceae bacterium]|nr:NfeD family protein [Oscillospiraceae bacterium]
MQFLFDNMWIVWLVLFVASIILEAVSFQLFSIWFALGALVALIGSLFGIHVAWQIAIFIVVSGAALGATRPLVRKMQRKQEPTNADRYIDQPGVVLEAIDNIKGTGQVKVLGQVWTARTKDGTDIAEGATVRTVAIEGVKLFVEIAE